MSTFDKENSLHLESNTDKVNLSANYPDERRKIMDGTYSTKIVLGRQRKHILGTVEFQQNKDKMQKLSPGSEPSILNADAASLVNKYKGTGILEMTKGSQYPVELIDMPYIIGKTWVQRMQKYVETKRFRIVYSSDGVHIIPVSDYLERSVFT
jgi:hypothetical protein